MILSLFLAGIISAFAEKDPSYCKRYGFDSQVLDCSTCQIVKDTLENDEIFDICSECCSNFTVVCHFSFNVSFLIHEFSPLLQRLFLNTTTTESPLMFLPSIYPFLFLLLYLQLYTFITEDAPKFKRLKLRVCALHFQLSLCLF